MGPARMFSDSPFEVLPFQRRQGWKAPKNSLRSEMERKFEGNLGCGIERVQDDIEGSTESFPVICTIEAEFELEGAERSAL